MVPMLALARSTWGRTVEKAAVRWLRIVVSVLIACPIRKATNPTLPQYFLRAVIRGEYFLVFSASFLSQPRSLQKPISTMIIV